MLGSGSVSTDLHSGYHFCDHFDMWMTEYLTIILFYFENIFIFIITKDVRVQSPESIVIICENNLCCILWFALQEQHLRCQVDFRFVSPWLQVGAHLVH